MIKKLLNIFFATTVLFVPIAMFAQAPSLGTAANFVLFSTDGAVKNTGITTLTGKVGTNNGSSTGFGNVNGGMHDGDLVSAACAADLLFAYTQLKNAIPDSFPAPLLGNGQKLKAAVYKIASAATLNNTLTLDGENKSNAVFIFQIQGAFSTSANAKVRLVNGAKACNVFWKVEGKVEMAAGTKMCGTVVANNAEIMMNTKDTLEGRLLTTKGAITVDGIKGYTPIGCGSPTLSGPAAPNLGKAACFGIFSSDGPVKNAGVTKVKGDVGANVGLTTGYDSLLITGTIHKNPDSTTAKSAADLLIAYNYLNVLPADIELLYPAQFGNGLELTPHTYIMNGATTFTDTLFLNAQGNANAVFVLKLYGACSTSTHSKVILMNGAKAENVYWMINGAVEIYDNSFFNGTIISKGAINLYTGVTINGRALTGVGAVETFAINSQANIVPGTCSIPIGVGLSDEKTEAIVIYPNPFTTSLTFKLNNESGNASEFSLFNSLGEKVMSQSITESYSLVETSSIQAGVYYYKLVDRKNNVQAGRLICMK